ncbi:MAG TPA: cache domain-containing protein [Syntrophobacteraceae bacterium]|nr:cache domain-containing protein [Syntrophobacteraceae bacterium]
MKHESIFKILVLSTAVFSLAVCCGAVVARAQDDSAKEALAKESEDYCASTSGAKPTPEMIMSKVAEGAALIEKEGTAAFPKFKGKGSPFLFAGTYIWIHDGNCKMRMHPIKWKMEGNDYIGLKDTNGKRFFAEMNDCVHAKGACWVDYMWPKPGEKNPSRKISYVKLVKTPQGEEMVLGCGIYDMSDAQMDALVKGK